MADRIPIKAIPGGGSATALGEFEPGDTIDPTFLPADLDVAIGDVEEEGASTGGGPYTVINFTGIGTAVDAGGGKATVNIPDTNTDTLALTDVLEEGGSLGGPFGALNFVGIGTAVNSGGGLCTITIPDTNTDVAIGDVETDGATTGGGPYTVINFQAPLVATDAGGGQVDVSLPGASLQQGVVFPGQWGYMSAGGKGAGKGGTPLSGEGLLIDTDGVDNSDTVTASASGVALIQLSDGTNNFELKSRLEEKILRYDNGLLMIQKFALLGTTTVRYFVGLFDDASAEPTAADDIGGQGVGIVFSTSRPDTNFQFVAHTGGAQALVDTGVAIAGGAFCLVVRRNAGTPANYDVELRSGDFDTLLASTTFTAAQLGAATNPMKLGLYAQALAAGVISQAHYHVSVVLEGV